MTQIYKIDTGTGPVPPAVATSYVTDINSPAIPALNILDVFGNDTNTNNVNGIQTDGSSGSNILTVQLTNRISVSATTSDGGGQTQNVVVLTPANATSLSFTILVTGYDSINNETIGGEQIGVVRKVAGVPTIVGTNDTFDESDAGLNAADWNVVVSGADLVMQFVGVAGRSIVWRSLFEYIQAP